MVGIPQRMRKLHNRLLAIRTGPGAAVLPKDVQRIELQFARKIDGGHMGPRKFWRQELVRLKYHNPSVPMTVSRSTIPDDPAILSIHYRNPAAAASSSSSNDTSATDAAAAPARVETINMKNYTNSEIWDAVLKLTKAEPVPTSPEDQELLEEMERQRVRSEREAALSAQVRAKAKREQELLDQAKGAIEARA